MSTGCITAVENAHARAPAKADFMTLLLASLAGGGLATELSASYCTPTPLALNEKHRASYINTKR